MVKFEYVPEDGDLDVPIKLEIGLNGEASVDDHFNIWISFMKAMTFSMDKYKLVKDVKCNCQNT